MRTPNTFQIGSTTYTTREYCNARGITDNARILKIQWRINTYIRNHTIQQTIEELDRLTLHPAHSTRDNTESGIRPWLGTKQELLKHSEWMNSPLKTPPSYESLESMLGAEDPRLQNLEKIRETSRPNAIENAITQYAEAIQTVNRRKKELAEAQNALNRWAEVTTNLLNAETSSERTNRFNKVNNT
jgi:hypothetical protein